MSTADYETSVFLNCPFDEDYQPILQAILFCIVFFGLTPRIALERLDSGESRLAKISELVSASKFSIHDLSRCQSTAEGEHFRMNMPFELGMDYGCRQFGGDRYTKKKILVLEEKKYRYQAALSDFSGCDIEAHGGAFETAVRKTRNWLCNEAGVESAGARSVINRYYDFQEWHYESQLAKGFDEEDIRDYPTKELLASMKEWTKLGRPLGRNGQRRR